MYVNVLTNMLLFACLLMAPVVEMTSPVHIHPHPHRCGKHFPVWVNGTFRSTGCPTSPEHPIRCCSQYSWCGSGPAHCCPDCPVFRYYTEVTNTFYAEVEFASFTFLDPSYPHTGESGHVIHVANCTNAMKTANLSGFINSIMFTNGDDGVIVDEFVCFGEVRVKRDDNDSI